MPLTQIAVTIAATGVRQQVSKSLPLRTGGTGNLLTSATASAFSDSGTIYMQNVTFQNQGSNSMYIGNAQVANVAGGGLLLTQQGSFTDNQAINYGTYVSDWWVAGTAGDILFLIFNQ